MNSISESLASHYAQGTTTLAQCWKCTRADGEIFGFTTTDADLVIDGVTYEAAAGFTPSDIEHSADLSVPNLEVAGMLDSVSITEQDLMAGVWDGCEIEIFEVNFRDLTMGRRILGGGKIGHVTTGRQSFTAELRGLMQQLQQTVGNLYSATCRYNLGDARCKVNLAAYTVAGAITAVTDRRTLTASALTQADDYFKYGNLTFTAGANDGISMEVKSFAAGVLALQFPMPYAVAVGDTFTVTPGCNKIGREGDCKIKFNNFINFGGEPDVPGMEQLLKKAGT